LISGREFWKISVLNIDFPFHSYSMLAPIQATVYGGSENVGAQP
jgi:hypothetical protein